MATESLGDELYRRASFRNIWLNLIPRFEYPQKTGLTQSTFTIGRSEATSDTESWSAVQANPNSCNVTWNDVQVGYNEVTWAPEQFGLRGPVICQDELIYNFKSDSFLEAYLQQLTKRSERSIQNRLQNIYQHFVPKHRAHSTDAGTQYQAGSGAAPSGATINGVPVATCQLSQEMLDEVAAQLNEEGASDPNSSGWITLGDDGPVYPLLIGQRQSQELALNNSELRQDFRWAQPMDLLKRIGASRVIRNFRHVINLFPPRFNFVGNQYVRINTWRMINGSKGTVADINPDWRTAPYEAAFVLNPWVYNEAVIRPVNSAAGLNWMPKNYFGEWQFLTGGKEITDNTEQGGTDCYDPTKKLGRHFAEYKHAAKPIFPTYGRMLLFKRCETTDFSCTTCAS
jgi:hypothetical protein